MYNLSKDDYDESIEDIMASIDKMLAKTGKGFEIGNKAKEKEQEEQA